MKFATRTARCAQLGCALSLAIGGYATANAGDSTDYLIFKVGKVTLRPLFESNETFNDNIFYQKDHATTDFITTVTPGLKVQLGQVDGNFFNVTFRHDELLYADQSHLDASQNRVGTKLFYDGARLSIQGSDTFESLASPLGGGISTGGALISRDVFNDGYTAGYRISQKTKTYTSIAFSKTDYDKKLFLFDTTTLRGTVGFEYSAFAKTPLFGEVYYGQTVLDLNASKIKPPTATFVGGFTGARGEFTEKMIGTIKIGYESRSFSGSSAPLATGDSIQGLSSPVAELDISQRFTEKLSAVLSYQRSQQVSVEYQRAALVSDSVKLVATQVVGASGKLRFELSLGYTLSAFEPNATFRKRNDDIFDGGLSMFYAFQPWLVTYASFNMQRFQSDLPIVVDYNANRVTVGLNIGY